MTEPTEQPAPPASSGVDTIAESPDDQAGAPDGRDGDLASLRVRARVASVVAVVALLAAAVFAAQWWSLAADANARDDAREAAEIMAARVTTFEGAAIDDFIAELHELATDEYAAQITELFDRQFRDALRDNEVESVGQVTRSFVQDYDGDEAEVFVLVRQTSINAVTDEPVEDELRMELTLAREGGRWLMADVAVLGSPSGPAPPPAATAPADGEGR